MKWLEFASATILVSLTIAVVAVATDPLPSHRLPRPRAGAIDVPFGEADRGWEDGDRDSPRPGLPGAAEYERKQAGWDAPAPASDAATARTGRNRGN